MSEESSKHIRDGTEECQEEHSWEETGNEFRSAGVYTGQYSDAYVGTRIVTYRCARCGQEKAEQSVEG